MRMREECDTDSWYSSSIENFHEEKRVMLRIGGRLRHYLDYDRDMICHYKKQHMLPARVCIVTILENFVKYNAFRMALIILQSDVGFRRRATQQRADKKEREFEKLVATISLLKEFADGLRIYFDFTVADYLLYRDEKFIVNFYLSDDYLKKFIYIPSEIAFWDEMIIGNKKTLDDNSSKSQNGSLGIPILSDEPKKRKLRSHRTNEQETMLDMNMVDFANSFQLRNRNCSNSYESPLMANITPQMRDFLQNLLSWRLLSTNAKSVPSMIFGAPHLARLIVKLPAFLNASSMTDEKLKLLLKHLDSFVNYLESHRDWFSGNNYVYINST